MQKFKEVVPAVLQKFKAVVLAVLCHRVLHGAVGAAYAAGAVGADKATVGWVLAGLYLVMAARG
ncbi:hypothetical protein ABGN05_22205 [Aquibium sp. LZ166]|uniref:Uncharacterized protein n=2 Tax=Aquibium pacificus TaxID=3153579 RepID=A0ABV3SNL3_9HYPH